MKAIDWNRVTTIYSRLRDMKAYHALSERQLMLYCCLRAMNDDADIALLDLNGRRYVEITPHLPQIAEFLDIEVRYVYAALSRLEHTFRLVKRRVVFRNRPYQIEVRIPKGESMCEK